MALKEFAAKQAAAQILPMVGKLSDRNLELLWSMFRQLAPTDYTRFFMDRLESMTREQHPTIELIRRTIRQTNPLVRKRLVNSLLINQLMRGNVVRQKLQQEINAAPQTFLISPTMRCNLRCPGCYAGNYSQQDELDTVTIDRVVREGMELGIFWVTILGGEPFLRKDMLKVYQKHHEVFFLVFTNGTLIDTETALSLAGFGNVFVIFSIEGLEEDTEARRGPGVYGKIMRAMDDLRRVGVPFGFSSMVTRYNVDTVISDEFNDMLIDKGCLVGWHFLYIPVDRDADINMMPTVEQRDLMRRRGALRIREEKPLFVMDFWNDAPFVSGCIAGGNNYFHITASGDVEPCIFVHLAVDNIRSKSLREVIDSPYFRAIRERQPYSENLLRPCMIIDHPNVLREICAKCKPYPTDGMTAGVVSILAAEMDRYSCESARILDPVWEEEFGPVRRA